MSVPRTGTGGLAEKATGRWDNPVQGTRQIGSVSSREGVSAVLTYLTPEKGEG